MSSFKVGNGKNKNGVVLARHVTLKGKTFLNLYDIDKNLNLYDVDKNIQVQLKSWPKVLDGSVWCLELRSSFQDWDLKTCWPFSRTIPPGTRKRTPLFAGISN